MVAVAANHFSAVKYIQELRKADFTEIQAEIVARAIEQQAQTIDQQQIEINAIKAYEPATKKDLDVVKLELQKEIGIVYKEIETVRKEIGVAKLELQKEIEIVRKEIVQSSNKTLLTMGGFAVFFFGVLAKGFHWF